MTDFEKPLIFQSMAAVMADITAIGKSDKNKFHGYNFRGIDKVYNEIQPLLKKHQIFCTSEILSMERKEYKNQKSQLCIHAVYKYRYYFFTVDGSSISTESIGEAIDTNGDKVSNKCASISHKYAIVQTFCIPTQDMEDPDREGPHDKNIRAFKEKYQNPPKPPTPQNPRPAPKPSGFDPKNEAHTKALFDELQKRNVAFEKWEEIGNELKGKTIITLDEILKEMAL